MVDGEWAYVFFYVEEFGERNEGVGGGAYVEFGEDGRIAVELRQRFDEDIVLVDLGVDQIDFVVGIGIGEIAFDVGSAYVVVIGTVAIDAELPLGLRNAQIARDLREVRIEFHLFDEGGSVFVEVLSIERGE